MVTVPANATSFTITAYSTNGNFLDSAAASATYSTAVTVVSDVQTLANGKRVLYVDGKPFQAYGGQMRVDTWRRYAGYNNEQMAALNLFAWPSNLDMNVVQVPIYWGDIEPVENAFTNWTNLQWAIGQCLTNGLRMEILWFGSDISGQGNSYLQPAYILNNPGTHPLMVSSNGVPETNDIIGLGGYEWTLSKEYAASIAAESNAVFNMLGYLMINDTNHVVIGVQIEDEPSIILNGDPPTDRDHSPNANALYTAGGYTNALDFCKQRLAVYLNSMAGAVKASPYRIWTRVNWVSTYWDYDEDVGIMRQLGTNVDFIGWDPYGMEQAQRYLQLAGDLSNSNDLPYVAEEPGGQDGTCRQKIIDVFAANGGGCCFYRVDTYATNEDVDNYLINPDGTDARPWTDEIRQTFSMLRKVMGKMAVLEYSTNASTPIQYFNSFGSTETYFNGTNMLDGRRVEYCTTNAGVGVAFVDGDDTVLMSARAGSFTLDTGPGVFEDGYYDTNGNWVAVAVHSASNNVNGTTTINLSATVPYEVVKFRAALSLAVTSVDGGFNPTAGAGFSVVVQAQDANGVPLALTNNTPVTLSLMNGSGTLGGTLTGTIPMGSNSVTITGVTYTKAESGVVITATQTGGENLVAGASAGFTVNPGKVVSLVLASGNNQSGFIDRALASPFVIMVTDANGNLVSTGGLPVIFAIASTPGGASGQSLGATVAVTGANGQASSTLTLGNVLGTYRIMATSGSLSGSPVTFTAAAIAPLTKSGTGTDLTSGASWTGVAPTSSSTAYWNSSSLGDGLTLGTSASWGGINVAGALTSIRITGTGTLTLGASGIDMSVSPVNLSLGIPIVLGASQTWNVTAGATLAMSGNISGRFGLTKSGAGTLTLSGNNSYTGTTIINGGTLALAAQPVAGSTLWLDGTRGISSSGGNMISWADQSGNGFNATPGIAPTLGTINGLQAVSFDGASQGLNIATSGLLTGTNESVFAVAQNENSTNYLSMLLCENINGDADAGTIFFESGSPPSLGFQKNQPNWDTIISTTAFGTGATLNEMVRGGTNSGQTQLFINGNLDSASNAISALIPGDHVNIGYEYQYGAPQRWFQGLIGEILVYPSALSTKDRQTVENYLGNKWLRSGIYNILSSDTSVQIAAGATLDVSGLGASAHYTIGSSAGLLAGGTGTAIGISAAAIKGGSSGTVNLASCPITLNYDGSDPALYISQGTLVLNGDEFIINSASPLAAGIYTIVQQAAGAITVNGSCSVSGTAMDGLHSGSIQVVGTNVELVVESVPPPASLLGNPTNNETFIPPASIPLSANITANGHTISAVNYYNNNIVLIGTSSTGPAFTANWSGAVPGNYKLTAVVVYDSTLSVTSAPVAIQVLGTPEITGYSMQSGGPFHFTFYGIQGQTFRLLSTNVLTAPLKTWPVLSDGTFGVGGVCNFTDQITPSKSGEQFYRIVSP
jgi:autotransporter-associated beta strand protein